MADHRRGARHRRGLVDPALDAHVAPERAEVGGVARCRAPPARRRPAPRSCRGRAAGSAACAASRSRRRRRRGRARAAAASSVRKRCTPRRVGARARAGPGSGPVRAGGAPARAGRAARSAGVGDREQRLAGVDRRVEVDADLHGGTPNRSAATAEANSHVSRTIRSGANARRRRASPAARPRASRPMNSSCTYARARATVAREHRRPRRGATGLPRSSARQRQLAARHGRGQAGRS